MGKLSGGRIHLRLPLALYNRVLELGEALGYDSPATAGRYFLTVGIQQSMAQLHQGRIRPDAGGARVAKFPDLFAGGSPAANSPKSAARKPAPPVNAKRPAKRAPAAKK